MEDQLSSINQTVMTLQSVVMNSGLFETEKGKLGKPGDKERGEVNKLPFSNSETTIYNNLLEQRGNQRVSETEADVDNHPELGDDIVMQEVDQDITFKIRENRGSSSSDDPINTSDEISPNIDYDKFIAECERDARHCKTEPQEPEQVRESNPYKRGGEMMKEASVSRPELRTNAGKRLQFLGNDKNEFMIAEHAESVGKIHSHNFDQEYMVIGGHLDSNLQERLINFEYVDFSRLIPCDRVNKLEDNRFELVMRGGSTFFAPVADRDCTNISNFSRWEQAFRIYSNVLTKVYPAKASELIQYNHTIYTAALTFTWENVYHYDKEFRMHISKFPQRSWSVILQQAWSMCLKDRVKNGEEGKGGGNTTGPGGPGRSKVNEPCKRYNKGKCTYGKNCIYEHRCAVPKCRKFGHGAHICRMRN